MSDRPAAQIKIGKVKPKPQAISYGTKDSFVNWMLNFGVGTNNATSASGYGFNPISRIRTLLEYMYRGSWLVGVAVDAVADDMTRAGIDIRSGMDNDEIEALQLALQELLVWHKLNETLKWSRLYGGAIAVLLIDGQDFETPLRPETIGRGQFRGLQPLDRWQVTPSLQELVTDFGPDLGLPQFYDVVADAPALRGERIHHTRCIRFVGIELPYYQRIAENLWGISILERLYDRLIAFDSTTTGAAQLIYKAHLRALSIKDLRTMITTGGLAYESLLKQIEMMRYYQSNEGMSILDADDKFEAHQYSFAGLSDMILQFGQQVSGALQIPLVRLFGQSPVGLNATGESDFRNYYDGINSKQETGLRLPLHKLLDIVALSTLGKSLPDGFAFIFQPLWQLSDMEKADLAARITGVVVQAQEAALVGPQTALKELRESSRITGIWGNITDADIETAALAPPSPMGAMGGEGMPGQPGEQPKKPPGALGTPTLPQPKKPPGEDEPAEPARHATHAPGGVVITGPGGTEVKGHRPEGPNDPPPGHAVVNLRQPGKVGLSFRGSG